MLCRMTYREVVLARDNAIRLARRYFKVYVRLRDICTSPRTLITGEMVLDVNPPVYAEIKAKSRCPEYLKYKYDGLRYNAEKEYEGTHGKSLLEIDALAPVIAHLMKKAGYNGYIQDELPF